MVERSAAVAAQEADIEQQSRHQSLLFTASCGMGLIPAAQGVTPPTNLGFEHYRNQEEALGELAQHTNLVDNH